MNKKSSEISNLQVPPISPTMLAKLKENVLMNEFFLLEEIGFNVKVKLPYKYIAKYVETLGLTTSVKNNFLRIAYRFANDFFRTSAPLVKNKVTIAEACLYLAAKSLKFEISVHPDFETLQILNIAIKIECIH